ncbi:MAG: glutathione S-transferase family protein [Burkholderiales bacterium]
MDTASPVVSTPPGSRPEPAASPAARHGLVLVSHVLCPYVQRAAIVLAEKGVPFERVDIDLSAKPEWFLAVSPLGRTPVLLVDGVPVFESAVICEYLDETLGPRLHPADPLERAQHRAWIEFGSSLLNSIAGFYAAPDEAALAAKAREIATRLAQLETRLASGSGPWFGGEAFGLVDAVFGPVFRYFDAFDAVDDFGWHADAPRLRAWRERLARRPSVAGAVRPDYPQRLRTFLLARGSALSTRMRAAVPAPAHP